MLISVQYRLNAIDLSFAPSLPKHRQESAREAIGGHTVRLAGTMAPPPDAVPDEVQAALSGMMEQLAASAAPTEAEREQQYDVLAGMLAAATACSSPSCPETARAESSATTSDAPPVPEETRAATTQGGPAASEDASTGTAKQTRTAKSSYVAQQKIEAVRGHGPELEHPAALCGPRCNPM